MHDHEQAFDSIFIRFKIGQSSDVGKRGADGLGLRIGREIAELLHKVAQEKILTTASDFGDVGKNQPFQIGRVIPPGGRGVAGEKFAPATGEGDRRLVKISGMVQAGVSMLSPTSSHPDFYRGVGVE
jgi:hypothetical protein